MKFLWLDECYPAAWKALGEQTLWTHGTADYWDVALREAGHGSMTFLENSSPGKVYETINDYSPNVICVQNVGRGYAKLLTDFKCKKVAFVSYRADDAAMTAGWDCVFTSFPWLVPHLKKLGQRAEFLPLAFGRPILDRVDVPPERDLPLTFVGGIGHTHIWDRGTDAILAVAEAFPDIFKWWGYRPKRLPMALERTWQGEAWGADYFHILMRSQITLNRHGEIAKGFANNLRLFEATGCGACLMTEWSPNLNGYFDSRECQAYVGADDLIGLLRTALNRPKASGLVAANGLNRCLADHCYENRVPKFLEVVESL